MEKYLSKFQYYSGYTNVVDTQLTRPHVSYIVEEDRIIYDSANGYGDNQILAGDIVCVKDGVVTCIPYSNYNTGAGYTPIAIVAIPPTHTPDGSTRAISLVNMWYGSPETGTTTLEASMFFGGYGVDTSLANLTKAIIWNNNSTSPSYSTDNSPYLPMTLTVTSAKCVNDTASYYNGTPFAVGPYANSGVSEYYKQEKLGSVANALADMDGQGNTERFMALQTADWTSGSINNSAFTGNYPMVCCCKRFRTAGTLAGTWYMPSCGEMGYVAARMAEINASLIKVGGARLNTNIYNVTSTEYSNANMRSVSTYNGRVYTSGKAKAGRCRAFHKFYF